MCIYRVVFRPTESAPPLESLQYVLSEADAEREVHLEYPNAVIQSTAKLFAD